MRKSKAVPDSCSCFFFAIDKIFVKFLAVTDAGVAFQNAYQFIENLPIGQSLVDEFGDLFADSVRQGAGVAIAARRSVKHAGAAVPNQQTTSDRNLESSVQHGGHVSGRLSRIVVSCGAPVADFRLDAGKRLQFGEGFPESQIDRLSHVQEPDDDRRDESSTGDFRWWLLLVYRSGFPAVGRRGIGRFRLRWWRCTESVVRSSLLRINGPRRGHPNHF